MAMTKCSECGHDVSDKAVSCPSCGMPFGPPTQHFVPPPNSPYAQPYGTVDPPRKSMSALTIILIIFGIMGFGVIVLAAILFPVFSQAKMAAKKTATLSNVKQLGTGLAIYMSDFDDVYPFRFGSNNDLKEFLMPYIKSEERFTSFNPNGGEILPNSQLQKFSASAVMDTRDTVTLFEAKEWPQEGKCYGFVDTHAQFLKSEDGITFDPKKNMSR